MSPNSRTPTPPRPGIGYRLAHALTGPVMKLLGLSCRNYAELCSARLDRALTSGEHLRFRFHGLICHLCRPLPRHLEQLRTLTRRAACEDPAHCHEDGAPAKQLDVKALERIRQALRSVHPTDPP